MIHVYMEYITQHLKNKKTNLKNNNPIQSNTQNVISLHENKKKHSIQEELSSCMEKEQNQ